jgi:hypothetical protein
MVAPSFTMRSVQRLYSMFPTGRPGVALLLLRVALSVLLLGSVVSPLARLGSAWFVLVPGALAFALCLGCFTPVVASLCFLFELGIALVGLGVVQPVHAGTILDAAALVLLGPGAYSLDARWFGRRQIIPAQRGSSHQP